MRLAVHKGAEYSGRVARRQTARRRELSRTQAVAIPKFVRLCNELMLDTPTVWSYKRAYDCGSQPTTKTHFAVTSTAPGRRAKSKPGGIMLLLRTLRAARFLIKGPILLVVLVIINAVTSPHDWWVKWPALAICVIWILSLLRVIRALIMLGGLAALIAFLRKK
jgi:hypothetical protein